MVLKRKLGLESWVIGAVVEALCTGDGSGSTWRGSWLQFRNQSAPIFPPNIMHFSRDWATIRPRSGRDCATIGPWSGRDCATIGPWSGRDCATIGPRLRHDWATIGPRLRHDRAMIVVLVVRRSTPVWLASSPPCKLPDRGSIASRSRFDRIAIVEFFHNPSTPSDRASGNWRGHDRAIAIHFPRPSDGDPTVLMRRTATCLKK